MAWLKMTVHLETYVVRAVRAEFSLGIGGGIMVRGRGAR